MKIQLLSDLKSCITDGERLIKKGTVMHKYCNCCNWTFFKGEGFTLILMSWEDWQNVEVI